MHLLSRRSSVARPLGGACRRLLISETPALAGPDRPSEWWFEVPSRLTSAGVVNRQAVWGDFRNWLSVDAGKAYQSAMAVREWALPDS